MNYLDLFLFFAVIGAVNVLSFLAGLFFGDMLDRWYGSK